MVYHLHVSFLVVVGAFRSVVLGALVLIGAQVVHVAAESYGHVRSGPDGFEDVFESATLWAGGIFAE